jgi:hypothetical protein
MWVFCYKVQIYPFSFHAQKAISSQSDLLRSHNWSPTWNQQREIFIPPAFFISSDSSLSVSQALHIFMADMSASQGHKKEQPGQFVYRWEIGQGLLARLSKPFRGMYHDVRRRLPYYGSDFRDGWAYRVFAGTIRIYFVNLLPALAFQLDMSYNTDGFFGINEALLASALAAIVFSLLSAQPLTVVGVTGLISLFNYTIYDIIKLHDVTLYPRFLVWVGIWAAVFHWATAIFNLCDYMRTITDLPLDSTLARSTSSRAVRN